MSTPLSARTSYVCQSCMTTLRALQPGSQQSFARHASTFSRRPPPRRSATRSPIAVRSPAAARSVLRSRDAKEILSELQDGEALPENDGPPTSRSSLPNGGLNVNYFEYKGKGEYKKLKNNDEFSASASGLDEDVAMQIDKLEAMMLKTLRRIKEIEKTGDPDKADDMMKQFKKSLRLHYKGKVGPEAEEYGVLRIPGFSGPRQRAVTNLNSFLARESVVRGGIPKQKDLVDCWRYYSAARKTLATAWETIPREVWDFIWMILSWDGEGVDNANRMHHVYTLAKDMNAAGVELRGSQQLLAIEAMFIEGWKEEAIEAWKKAVVTLGAKPETFKGYWELGVRMCALHGDIERSVKAAETVLESAEQPDARILFPIIRALSIKDTTSERAWEKYQEMRKALGDTMTIEDYDDVIAIFLENNRVELALQAFVDMMFSGAIDVRGRTKLPMAVSNQFFVGKWLKRLIGAGDLDGAYKVVAFLQEKGVSPSPHQLNGLIGAWIRSEDANNLDKAEQMAWDMIHCRLRFVHRRGRQASMHKPIRFYEPFPRPGPVGGEESEFHCATRATTETFSILAENYCDRKLDDRLRRLWEAFQEAELGVTSFLMNQLIRSHAQSGQADKAVQIYEEMTQEQNIAPDAYTFRALYNTLSVNRLITRDPELAERDAIQSRRFFAELVNSDWKFDGPDVRDELSQLVLFSMLKTTDYAGMIIATRAMAELFDFVPWRPLLIGLVAGTETLRVKTKRNITRAAEADFLIHKLQTQYRERLAAEGYGGEMTMEQRNAEPREILEKLILIKAKATDVPEAELLPALEDAAQDMDVYDIVLNKDPARVARHRKINATQ
ncbi:hypothetical protein OQA88_6736 [Cercophora sp. LCS_1]